MKTICRLADFERPNISLYIFDDDTRVAVGDVSTVVGLPARPDLIIMDCTKDNCVLHEGVEQPIAYKGWKYTYTEEDGWAIDEEWPALRARLARTSSQD